MVDYIALGYDPLLKVTIRPPFSVHVVVVAVVSLLLLLVHLDLGLLLKQ